ncbi:MULTISPECIES: DUF2840 domain-containing protein [unclassified Novosphingobium]|uniref:DUF2840 domain-containing protein n=1 Tax=unclassified Novosphingobium TaxID=2644732 RepID=UPI00146A993C|nr:MULTISPECIES: DUF2840 domain-containing protein [unclassified Novosphingobium]NMN03835.1 hypothetical protein [Novosphingobium sp. SG919]NMN86175.1 hypothetical protein [Novosphingobium sp. SG916]
MTRLSSPSPADRAGRAGSTTTEVELIWIEKRLEHWIRFGRVAAERIISRRSRVVAFRESACIAFVQWSASDYGTVRSRIDILRCVGAGEAYTTVPFVRPGGELLLSIRGWPRVQRVLQAIDAVEAAGIDACDAAPDHWRHVHNRLTVGEQPRGYTRERHEAWLKRKAAGL